MSQNTKTLKYTPKLGVRAETYEKFKRIAKQTRRTMAETADVLADDYLSKNPSVETSGEQAAPTQSAVGADRPSTQM